MITELIKLVENISKMNFEEFLLMGDNFNYDEIIDIIINISENDIVFNTIYHNMEYYWRYSGGIVTLVGDHGKIISNKYDIILDNFLLDLMISKQFSFIINMTFKNDYLSIKTKLDQNLNLIPVSITYNADDFLLLLDENKNKYSFIKKNERVVTKKEMKEIISYTKEKYEHIIYNDQNYYIVDNIIIYDEDTVLRILTFEEKENKYIDYIVFDYTDDKFYFIYYENKNYKIKVTANNKINKIKDVFAIICNYFKNNNIIDTLCSKMQ